VITYGPGMKSLRRGLGETASDNATAFGFSLTIGGAGLIAADLHGSPAVPEVFLLIGGAALAMIFVAAVSTGAFRSDTPESLPEKAQMRGAALNFLSVGLGLLAAWGLSSLIDSSIAWFAAGLSAILVYLVTEALEYSVTLRMNGK
jgi:hypothetical protein